MIVYTRYERMTVNTSQGDVFEVEGFKLSCPETVALLLLSELPSEFSLKPFPGTIEGGE